MNNIKKYAPLLFIELYLAFTIILFAVGPWDFPINNQLKLYSYLILYQVFLAIGYHIGINYIKISPNEVFNNQEKNLRIVKILMPFYLVILLIDITRNFGLSSINLFDIFERLVYGIQNPALSYYAKFDVTQSNVFLGSFGTIIIFLGSPISYLLLSLLILYFNNFNIRYKTFSVVIILLYLIRFIAVGTNKGVFDIIIILVSTIILYLLQKKTEKRSIKNNLRVYITIVLLFASAVMVFNYMIGSRSIGTNYSKDTKIGEMVSLKEDSFMMEKLPDNLEKPVVLLSTYLSQGYYGLSLAMQVPETPMFGLGNSMFIVDQVSKKIDIDKYTLQKKVEEKFGWDSRVQWSSMYSWIANDVGFLGTVFFMFILGLVFGMICKDILIYNNIIAKILFTFLMIQFFFIPANNQLMVNMNSFSSTIFTFLLWGISKKGLKVMKKLKLTLGKINKLIRIENLK